MSYKSFWVLTIGAFAIGIVNLVGSFWFVELTPALASNTFGQFGGLWFFLGMLSAWIASAVKSINDRQDRLEALLRDQTGMGPGSAPTPAEL